MTRDRLFQGGETLATLCNTVSIMLQLLAGWFVGKIGDPKLNRLDMRRPWTNSGGNRDRPPKNSP